MLMGSVQALLQWWAPASQLSALLREQSFSWIFLTSDTDKLPLAAPSLIHCVGRWSGLRGPEPSLTIRALDKNGTCPMVMVQGVATRGACPEAYGYL